MNEYSSPELNELLKALSIAQSSYPVIGSNRINPHYKSRYTDLDGIMLMIRPILAKNGLSFIQQLRIDNDGTPILTSILGHSSGQWISSRVRVNPQAGKNGDQAFGSSLTYLRRYSAEALLGVTTSDDPMDDDAEQSPVPAPKPRSIEPITKDQAEELEMELEGHDDYAKKIFSYYNVSKVSDLPKSDYHVIRNKISAYKANK